MLKRFLPVALVGLMFAPLSFADDCTQEEVKGDWQLQLTRLYGQAGIGLRCTLRITPKGNVASGNAATSCSYGAENTPTVKGSFTVTDSPAGCLLAVDLRISGGMSGGKATLKREFRLNEDRDAADYYDGVLNDQDNQEIFSGPVSLYKY